jgi:hypothetical protein
LEALSMMIIHKIQQKITSKWEGNNDQSYNKQPVTLQPVNAGLKYEFLKFILTCRKY